MRRVIKNTTESTINEEHNIQPSTQNDICHISSSSNNACSSDNAKLLNNSLALCNVVSSFISGTKTINNKTDSVSACNSLFDVTEAPYPLSLTNVVPTVDTFVNINTVHENKNEQFLAALTSWAIKTCLSHNAFNELLNVLHTYSDFEGIPKDCRTLLKFDKSLKNKIEILPPGQYYHFGLKQGIIETLKREKCTVQDNMEDNMLKVSVNIDGLPLTKSSSSQFWPILAFIENFRLSDPFPIGVYHGSAKPDSANEFLNALINEFKELKKTGLDIDSSHFTVEISSILCDAPAKSFVLNVKSHNSYSGCTKCNVVGEYTQHRMAYLNSEATLRCHEEFINMSDDEYHKGPTVLTELNIDLVDNVPLDYMHLVCLGVTKRLLTFWVSGRQGIRLFKEDIISINNRLEQLRTCSVKEFVRLPRSLKELDRWKATEFRQFLLYYGPEVLKNYLKEPMWSHFLSLHISIRILASADLSGQSHFLMYADKLLQYFVNKFGEIYGREYVGHNVHNLLHLVKDVRRFGPLDSFSCFRFENYMSQIKKTLKTSNHPLEQYINRHYEHITHCSLQHKKDNSFSLVNTIGFKKVDLENVTLFKELKGPNFHFSIAQPNCFAFLKSNLAIQFLNFFNKQDKIFFECKVFKPLKSFYKIPCDSLKINSGLVVGFTESVCTYMVDDILCKSIKIGDLLLPLLHS